MELTKAKTEEHGTPVWLAQELHKHYHFDLDAAAAQDNTLCENYFTIEQDTLKQDWSCFKSIYVNPPYNTKSLLAFTQKAIKTISKHPAPTITMLAPAKTEQDWWGDAFKSAHRIVFIKRRLRFRFMKDDAGFASVIIHYKSKNPFIVEDPEHIVLLENALKFNILVQPPKKEQRFIQEAWLREGKPFIFNNPKPQKEGMV